MSLLRLFLHKNAFPRRLRLLESPYSYVKPQASARPALTCVHHSLPSRSRFSSCSSIRHGQRTTPGSQVPEQKRLEEPLAPALTTSPSPAESPPEPKLSLTFTCTVESCGERSSHMFTKRAYERGIVLVQCPGCKNRHLIADHLGWFKESTEDGKLRTVEDLLRVRGERVRRGHVDAGGVVEYAE